MKFKDYYELLDVPRNATPTEIKLAYRRKAMKCHPDRTSAYTEEVFPLIVEAYETLIDEERRREYDTELMYKIFKDVTGL